ncbi:amine oxidase [Thalassoporum mexicanum PCC 7367]|uniref:hydroxysqualene dehydroxylase n=1 Tax=Thalassoporum mexicanum TaxID=3457544 RepID=UPI00029FD77A|nr:FAD-dependent oxidoreductase [Pseudanabaena sp. PCC 7367]AFY71835.1 amine oxidase [Pseudanabaena sp. PCC 7367]
MSAPDPTTNQFDSTNPPRVVVVGAGWAGLSATYHLAKQGYDVTLLEAGAYPGGLVAGWETEGGRSVEAGIHGFWYPYANIFNLVDELGIKPFTDWTRSGQYSPAGLEVEAPIFQDLPTLPSPLGTFLYTKFKRLPLSDRLSALPLMYALLDFDNSPEAWRRYDGITARELFKQYGVSARLYHKSFNPMLLVGLFAPGEQCSAAAALGMLYYFILAHQADFDVVWCRGTVGAQIFRPWVAEIEQLKGKIQANRRVVDVKIDPDRDQITEVIASGEAGSETYPTDAVVFAVGITGLKKIVAGCPALADRPEFRNINNLGAVDVLATRFWCDRPVKIPHASNACFGFDTTTGWTFFDLNALHDEYKDEPGTVVEADFYHANQFMPMSDEAIETQVQRYLATCLPDFASVEIVDRSVIRLPQAVTHFAPGSYQYLLPTHTSFSNVFMSGDWITTQHGSWSQEKAFVTGLEATNAAIAHLGYGDRAGIIPVAADEPHIQLGRAVNKLGRDFAKNFLPEFWLP